MEDQSKFMESLEEIKNIAVSQQNKLTKDEVQKYLSDMKLGADKFEAVYHYLALSGIEIEGYKFVPSAADLKEEQGDETGVEDNDESHNSTIQQMVKASEKGNNKEGLIENKADFNRKLYLDEVDAIGHIDSDSEKKLIEAFLDGDKQARDRFVENRLTQVMNIADKYNDREAVKNKLVTLDEVIAEGNMGLLIGMSVIEGSVGDYRAADGTPNYEAIDGTLYMEIAHAMESMIDSMTEEKDWENAVLARTNLLNEAAKYMTEEIGRVPTKEELSEYTKISIDEIKSIMGLSEDTKRVARPEL